MSAQIRLNLAKANVLLVEDNPNAMELLAQILTGFGVVNARKAPSAEEARALSEAEPYTLIILDAEMAGEDGFDFARSLRCDTNNPNCTTAIIMVSGFAHKAKVEKARDCGVNIVVAKPIMPEVLLDRIAWVARETREFVACDTYRGPDRRFQSIPLLDGAEERRADALRMMAAPERELSQDEISSLFS